jgi:tetratricopeptide (TPR) repeat protein
MNLLILLLSARGEDIVPIDPGPPPEPEAAEDPVEPETLEQPSEPPPLTLEEVWAQQDPVEVLTQAVAFQEVGNRHAALDRLRFLEQTAPSTAVRFQLAKTLELLEDYDGALAGYESVLADGPSEYRHNAAFRRIIVLEDVGRSAESLAAVKALQAEGTWSEVDALTLSLAQGISELSDGRTRRGIKHIEASLAALEDSSEATWMRARARAALARVMLDEAAGLTLVGNKKAARRLGERSALMVAAEQQVIAIAHLGEPEYALAGLLLLGDAYIMLHDDMLADEEVVIYRAEVESRVKILSAKAKNYYGEGLKLATRVGWEGALGETLSARHDAL